jgi:hypothetical protein
LTKNKPPQKLKKPQKPIFTTPRTTMGCHLSKPTASHEDELDAPSGQDAGRGNSPLEQSFSSSASASSVVLSTASVMLSEVQPPTMLRVSVPPRNPLAGSLVLSEAQPATVLRGAPLQDPLAGSLVLSEAQPATVLRGAPLQNPLAGQGAQPVDPRAVVADDALDISVGSEFADVAPQEACGAAGLPRELPTFGPIVSPHDTGASSASATPRPQSALRSASARCAPKSVSFAQSDASSLASSRGSSGPRRRSSLRHALYKLQRSLLPATPQQGSLLPATPHPRSLSLSPQQSSLVSVRCAGATPPQGSPLSAMLPATPLRAVMLPVDSSAEVNRAVLDKFKGNLLPAKR